MITLLALQGTRFRDISKLSLDRGDALTHHATIDLELAFALTAVAGIRFEQVVPEGALPYWWHEERRCLR